MSSKRYYWLRLKEDFFKQKEIKKLGKIAGGDTYIIIYLKLLLKSTSTEGKLYFDGIEDTFAEEIALDIDEEIENVKVTLMYLIENGLAYYKNPLVIKIDKVTSKRNRSTAEYREWRDKVFTRDDYTCQECKVRGVKLEAHHIRSWAMYPKLRFEIENGVTLCKHCHKEVHKRGQIYVRQ